MSAGTQQVPIPWTPAPPQLVMAYSVCKGITRTAAKNFYYAFMVLPRKKREALCAVYAFMRRCDDMTDAQRHFAIPAGLLDELAHGTAMDVEDSSNTEHAPTIPGLVVQYRTFEDLRLYCYRVASVVGLVCIHIFGYREPAAESLAERCGLAFQLTNIIRDVKEDAGMGRIYLPEEDLAKFDLSASELLATPDPARFRPLLALEADRAREFYASGEALIPHIAEDSQPALWVLVTIYRRLLDKIAEKQYDVFTAKVALSTSEKLRILGKGFLKRIA